MSMIICTHSWPNVCEQLAKQRNAVIEECAVVIEQWENDDEPRSYLDLIAAIRELKDVQLKDLTDKIAPENRHGEGEF